jgi:crotonobetainyl-CoA:carnitine CoA-transferase CaiB-like acyl-CoA transferase
MPLSGLRVVDLTRILAGPFCSMLLADMGAEVIKVETPGEGDPVRRQGVVRDGLSWYFAGFNRNKRSLTLNLRDAEGRAVLARLIAGSDVLVENFRPGVLAAMGFDRVRLAELNPARRIVSLTLDLMFTRKALSSRWRWVACAARSGNMAGLPTRRGPWIA